MSFIPQEIPTGAVRYNTDTDRMEVYIGSTWMEVVVSTPNLNGGARGVIAGNNPTSNVIQFFTIPIQANATDFGDLSQNRFVGGSGSSRTRGLFMGGDPGPSSRLDAIDFITIATTGNASDFGDAILARAEITGCCSDLIRGVFSGGNPNTNAIEKVTIATTGDAKDFGDLLVARRGTTSLSDSHGGLAE